MKKTISITVDVDAWINAKQKVDNLSAYLSDCLNNLAGTSKIDMSKQKLIEEIKDVESVIQEHTIKKGVLQYQLKELDFEDKEAKRIAKEREQFMRWKCPVDKRLNTMDMERCIGCGMKTRGESKTTVVYVDEDNNEVV